MADKWGYYIIIGVGEPTWGEYTNVGVALYGRDGKLAEHRFTSASRAIQRGDWSHRKVPFYDDWVEDFPRRFATLDLINEAPFCSTGWLGGFHFTPKRGCALFEGHAEEILRQATGTEAPEPLDRNASGS